MSETSDARTDCLMLFNIVTLLPWPTLYFFISTYYTIIKWNLCIVLVLLSVKGSLMRLFELGSTLQSTSIFGRFLAPHCCPACWAEYPAGHSEYCILRIKSLPRQRHNLLSISFPGFSSMAFTLVSDWLRCPVLLQIQKQRPLTLHDKEINFTSLFLLKRFGQNNDDEC